MAEHGLTHCDEPTHGGSILAWSLLNWDLFIPAIFTNSFVKMAG
jgi:hypothetical protein